MLTREQKEEIVQKLREEFERVPAVFLTSFKGITGEESNQLRRALREKKGRYQVVKNTILRLACGGTVVEPIQQFIKGPTGIAIAYEDPVEVAKVLVDFAKEHESLVNRGGVLQGKPIGADALEQLAKLPSREVLLAQLLATLQAPLTNFVQLFAGVPRNFLYVLKAIEEKRAAQAA